MAKIICSSRPNQNAGSDMPAIVMIVVARSNQRPRRIADTIPIGIVSASAHMIDTETSSIVAGSRSTIRAATGRPSVKLYPQSPRTNAHNHAPYCCHSGRSSPSARRSRSMSAGRTFGFAR